MHVLVKLVTLQWRHNGCDGVSNHQPHHCLLNCLFRRRSQKHQSSASLAFVREIHRWPVNFPHKWPVTRNMFPFNDVIMKLEHWYLSHEWPWHLAMLLVPFKNNVVWYVETSSKSVKVAEKVTKCLTFVFGTAHVDGIMSYGLVTTMVWSRMYVGQGAPFTNMD